MLSCIKFLCCCLRLAFWPLIIVALGAIAVISKKFEPPFIVCMSEDWSFYSRESCTELSALTLFLVRVYLI